MKQEDIQEKIQQYLDRELSEADVIAFEQQLSSDPKLKEELELEIAARLSTFSAGIQEQKEQFRQRYEQQHPPRTLVFLPYLIAAAAAIALLILGIQFFPSTNISSQDLYSSFYERPSPSIYRDSISNKAFASAQIAFAEGKFEEAAKHYQAMLQDSTWLADDEIKFFLGISHIELEEWSQAKEVFSQLNTSSDYQQAAEWYSAIASLKQGEITELTEQLQRISSNPTHHYREKAINLLEQIEK